VGIEAELRPESGAESASHTESERGCPVAGEDGRCPGCKRAYTATALSREDDNPHACPERVKNSTGLPL
jgi:hypothetical protein